MSDFSNRYNRHSLPSQDLVLIVECSTPIDLSEVDHEMRMDVGDDATA